MSGDEEAVLAANAAFYAAFDRCDIDAMDAIWARSSLAACVHPGWRPLRGRAEVMASWRAILLGPGAPSIRCAQPSAHACGDTAFVVCVEKLPGGDLVASNFFVREDSAWKLLHHHAGPIARGDEEETPPSDLLN